MTDLKTMKELLLNGLTYREVGNIFNISKQRVKQIIDKQGWLRTDIIARAKRLEIKKDRRKQYNMKRYGTVEGKDCFVYRQYKKIFNSKKANANQRGISFTILIGEIDWATHCPVFGCKLVYNKVGTKFLAHNWATIDRLDPNKPYEKGNVVVMSYRANRLKADGTLDEFKHLVKFLEK